LNSQKYIRQLEETLHRNQELEKENETLKKENEELKKRLLYYENPNTHYHQPDNYKKLKRNLTIFLFPKNAMHQMDIKEQLAQQESLMTRKK
jgi:hypothetical protein